MSDTPRTKAAIQIFGDYIRSEPAVPVDFAEELEVELSDAKTELAEARADLRLAKNIIEMHVERVAERDKLIEQMREALAAADDLIDEYAADYEHRDNVDEIREEIKAALSAAEGWRVMIICVACLNPLDNCTCEAPL